MAGAGGGGCPAGGNDLQWCFSQVKGAVDEDVAEADIISTVEFNYSGDLLATGDKGGRVVIFQREQEVSDSQCTSQMKASFSHVTWKEGNTGTFSAADFT